MRNDNYKLYEKLLNYDENTDFYYLRSIYSDFNEEKLYDNEKIKEILEDPDYPESYIKYIKIIEKENLYIENNLKELKTNIIENFKNNDFLLFLKYSKYEQINQDKEILFEGAKLLNKNNFSDIFLFFGSFSREKKILTKII